MTSFKWHGTNTKGHKLSGVIEAVSKRHTQVMLFNKGITIHSIQRQRQRTSQPSVPEDMTLLMMQQLATIAQCQVPIVPALAIVQAASRHRGMRILLQDIQTQLKSGQTLSNALARYPKIFDPVVLSLVKTGEQTGNFAPMLLQSYQYLQDNLKFKQLWHQAMLYPVVVLCIASILLLFLLLVVVPTFSENFQNFQIQLPSLTQAIINISLTLQKNVDILLFLSIGSISLVWYVHNTQWFCVITMLIKRNTPILRSLLASASYARFCQVAHNALQARMSLAEVLNLAAQSCGDILLERAIQKSAMNLQSSAGLYDSLKQCKKLPPLILRMIDVGERSGQLVQVLNFLATHYQHQAELKTRRFNALLEPCLIAILGMVVGIIILSMYLPIFELGNIS